MQIRFWWFQSSLTQNNDTQGSVSPPITRTRSHSGLLETSFDEEEGDQNQDNQDKSCERKRRQKTKDFQCQMDAGVDFATSDVIDIDDILGDHKIDTCDMGTDPAFDDNQELLRSLEDKLRYIKLSPYVKLFHLSLFGLSRRINFLLFQKINVSLGNREGKECWNEVRFY